MATIPAISFEANRAKELAEELVKNIQQTGFNALSKNDFYDFVLYLLDKYSKERFLLKNSNYANARLLKAKPEKIKTSKFNIFLKFSSEEEKKDVLLRFIRQIINGEISMKGCDGENKLQITIEDPAVYFCLEGRMKEKLGTGHDTSFNREIIKIGKKDFFVIMSTIINEDALFAENRSALEKRIKAEKFADGTDKVVGLLMDGVSKMTGLNFSGLLAENIKDGITKLYKLATSLS